MARSPRCSNCRKAAVYVARNAWDSSKNGTLVCASNVCWGLAVGPYPAEGRLLAPKN